ncbi:hypothetical protein KVV02_008791 [Mortierella alpina]|uniref:Uncharacterized protein n=1 Tax=Mortierella alpina TaxID=64518 RepID=A0A9P8A1Z0_MORAP|nr:hypothetical protein KVV02_008791 [Mortierella alpina]
MEKEEYTTERFDEKIEDVEDIGADYDLQEEDDSPIEEVRVTISNTDDPLMPCNTFRMWSLGLLFTAAVSFVNQFFYLRQTQISIGYSVVALVSLPLGHLMARVLPTRQMNLFGWSFSLNPGPFSVKEHILIGTMTAVNTSTAYAVDIVILQKLFYNSEKPFIAGLLLVFTTQVTGFALAGALRKRYRYNWWSRYNYLTSAALDTGVAICGLVIFFAIQSWEGEMPNWWGNPKENIDHCPLGGANYYGYTA